MIHANGQVLPKHTLEGVLCGLCGASSQDSSCNGDPDADGGRACVWTELTIPMLTAALNLKPPLSDVAISVLVRRVEASSEQPELQVIVQVEERPAKWSAFCVSAGCTLLVDDRLCSCGSSLKCSWFFPLLGNGGVSQTVSIFEYNVSSLLSSTQPSSHAAVFVLLMLPRN